MTTPVTLLGWTDGDGESRVGVGEEKESWDVSGGGHGGERGEAEM